MPYFIRIYCKEHVNISRKEIVHFIIDGVYFSEVLFEPKLESALNKPDWNSLTIKYEESFSPIILHQNYDDTIFQNEVSNMKYFLGLSRDSKGKQKVLNYIENCKNMFSFEIEREQISDDAWAMLDNLEAYISKKSDGIIYDNLTGFYDKNLKRFHKL